MNQNTRGRAIATGIGTVSRRWHKRESKGHGRQMPSVILASLGLASLASVVMWTMVSEAKGEAAAVEAVAPTTRALTTTWPDHSVTLEKTGTLVAPDHRDLEASGLGPNRVVSAVRQTGPVTIVTNRQRPANTVGDGPRSVVESTRKVRKTGQTGLEKPAGRTRPASRPVEQPGTRSPTVKRVKGRLPRYFGKVGISGAQKRRIYMIQATFRQKARDLVRQLEALKRQEAGEVRAVLTSLQRERLKELVEMAEASRAARANAKRKTMGEPDQREDNRRDPGPRSSSGRPSPGARGR